MSENIGFGRRAGNDMDMEMEMPPRASSTTMPQSPRNDNIKINRMSDSDGINIAESFGNAQQPEKVLDDRREEMKGPGNISDLLSGLKTKKVNMGGNDDDNNSVVSITELTEKKKWIIEHLRNRRRTTSERTLLV